LRNDNLTIPTISVADFWAKDDKLYFEWESDVSGSPIVEQILNAVLEVSLAEGDKPIYSRMFSLRVPVGSSPPINVGRVLSSDLGVESPSQTLASPPSPVPELGVEFTGALKHTSKHSSADGTQFQIDHRIQFEVQPILGSDDRVTLRVKYLGVQVSWGLPKDDPLRTILRTPPDLSRIQVSELSGIINHLSQRSADLQAVKKAKASLTAEKDDKKKQQLKESLDKLLGQFNEKSDDLDSDEKRCDDDLADAKSLQSLFDELQEATCGYRVYFTVHEHKVYLVTADTKTGVAADSKNVK
jgi:hypothetical protein